MSFSKTFWLVWSPEGKTPPGRTYDSRAQAVTVARDMTTKYPGQRFFALEAVAGFVSKVQLDELLVQPLSPPPNLAAKASPELFRNPPPPINKPADWGLNIGDTYRSQKGTSRVAELRNVDGRIAVVVYKPEDRPIEWRMSKWSSHLGDWWTPETLRNQGDPLYAYGRTPQPFSLPALYVL